MHVFDAATRFYGGNAIVDGVGGRLTEKEIRLWIVAPQAMNPAVAKRGYQLSEEDLNALVAYLTASSQQ
jgi:hypothetical protein